MAFKQLLVKKNLIFFSFFWGGGMGPPLFAPSKGGNQERGPPMTPYDPPFHFKILSYYQNEDVYKKFIPKIRLSQSQPMWPHCGQEICIWSQEMSIDICVYIKRSTNIAFCVY